MELRPNICCTGLKLQSLTVALIIIMFLICGNVQAAFHLTPVTAGYKNEIGLGLSYGLKLNKDSWFWGYAPDYVRVLGNKWLLNLSFAYDEETEKKDISNSITETWTPSVMIGYQLNPRMALGAGLGHGLIDNKNNAGWKSVKFGDDLSVAAAFAVSLWNNGPHGLALSVSLEHNISDNEPSFSTDVGYSWSF